MPTPIPIPGCFSSDQIVTTLNGSKKIGEIDLFEKVLTMDSTGLRKWTRCYSYAHFDSDAKYSFTILKFSNGKELVTTDDHLLFCCGTQGEKIPRKAEELKQGDKLFYMSPDGVLSTPELIGKEMVSLQGVYTPLTMSGDIFVNGFLASCYADIRIFKATHAGFAPLRAWCKMKNKLGIAEVYPNGIHGYPIFLMKFRDILPAKIKAKFV